MVRNLHVFFPTCQVRVVRFYQSCSPPRLAPPPRLAVRLLLARPPRPPPPPPVSPRPCLHQLPPALPPCQLFAKLFANSLRRALCQLPSSVCTAGPQPGTFPAQCAPLDLRLQPGTFPAQCAPLDLNLGAAQLSAHRWTSNLGAAQLSVHRWTSTWLTFPAQCAPLDLNRGPATAQIECQKISCRTSTGQIECQKICQIECQIECQKICI